MNLDFFFTVMNCNLILYGGVEFYSRGCLLLAFPARASLKNAAEGDAIPLFLFLPTSNVRLLFRRFRFDFRLPSIDPSFQPIERKWPMPQHPRNADVPQNLPNPKRPKRYISFSFLPFPFRFHTGILTQHSLFCLRTRRRRPRSALLP